MVYCQIVVGAPGAGKTTYCYAMQQFMRAIGREAIIVNLDPANEDIRYECAVNVTDLITVEDAMAEFGLGPNGGQIYCMEWLSKNMALLKSKQDTAVFKPDGESRYVLFDFPGQAELYTHNDAVKSVIASIQKWGYNPVAVHLTDSHLCLDPANFVSGLMMSLCVMFHLELPHVNVMTKVDLIEQYGELPFRLDFYTEVLDLQFLMEHIDPFLASEALENEANDQFQHGYSSDDDTPGKIRTKTNVVNPALIEATEEAKHRTPAQQEALERYRLGHRRLNTAVSDLIQDYSLVSFQPLSVEDKYAMHRVLTSIDKANGYIFANLDLANVELDKFKNNVKEDGTKLHVSERVNLQNKSKK